MERFYNQNNNYSYHEQPTYPTGQALATAAMIAGIVSVVTIWTLYLPIIVGGLGVIFAFLSLGFEKKFSSSAKTGLFFSISGLLVCIILLIVGTTYLLNNPDRFLEMAQQLDRMGASEFGLSYEESVWQMLDMLR